MAGMRPGLVMAAALAGTAGTTWLVLGYVPRTEVLQPADVIVVLGHPALADGTAGPDLREEVALAVDLHAAGLAPAVLFTGGAVHNAFVEAQVMAELARQRGMPASAILVDDQARDTVENAHNCRRIMQRRGWRRTIVVTTPYHARRARAIFRQAGICHQVAYAPDSCQLRSARQRLRALSYELVGQAWLLASAALGLPRSWQGWREEGERGAQNAEGRGRRSEVGRGIAER
jgi:uncharacterized SAM-binding protein YcdF (DUF218 family)